MRKDVRESRLGNGVIFQIEKARFLESGENGASGGEKLRMGCLRERSEINNLLRTAVRASFAM